MNVSSKESIALDQQEGTSTQSMAKKGKLHSFLEVPTSLACHSKVETRGAKVLTSHDYLEELEQKDKLKKEKEEQKEQKKRQREEKAKLKTSGTSPKQKLLRAKSKGNCSYSNIYIYIAS